MTFVALWCLSFMTFVALWCLSHYDVCRQLWRLSLIWFVAVSVRVLLPTSVDSFWMKIWIYLSTRRWDSRLGPGHPSSISPLLQPGSYTSLYIDYDQTFVLLAPKCPPFVCVFSMFLLLFFWWPWAFIHLLYIIFVIFVPVLGFRIQIGSVFSNCVDSDQHC